MTTAGRDIFSVSRLTSEVRAVLEGSFPLLWVEGEISNLSAPRSGHLYFTLKDAHAQVRCALFKNRRQLLREPPRDGQQVLVRARISLYEARGDFQMIIEHLEPAGDGALRRAYEQLKARLDAEGLFAPGRKLPLPAMPRRVGVVTSPSGAALRDILQVLARRAPYLPVRIYPALVQGPDAPSDLRAALAQAARDDACDLLILARGGGALEDLVAFNDEALARDIAALRVPLISAVGHEIDFTIADFVADRRAPTPSAAAELAAPAFDELLARVTRQEARLARAIRQALERGRAALRAATQRHRLLHPERWLQQQSQRNDELELRLRRALRQRLISASLRLEALRRRLRSHSPRQRLRRDRLRLDTARRRLDLAVKHDVRGGRARLQGVARNLSAVSSLATLARGYAIARRPTTKEVLRDAAQVSSGESIEVLLGQGSLVCEVTERR